MFTKIPCPWIEVSREGDVSLSKGRNYRHGTRPEPDYDECAKRFVLPRIGVMSRPNIAFYPLISQIYYIVG